MLFPARFERAGDGVFDGEGQDGDRMGSTVDLTRITSVVFYSHTRNTLYNVGHPSYSAAIFPIAHTYAP